jgi:hypothetical protein
VLVLQTVFCRHALQLQGMQDDAAALIDADGAWLSRIPRYRIFFVCYLTLDLV